MLTESESPQLNNGSVKEFGDTSKISTSATVSDADGNPKRGKDVYTDEVGEFCANQDWRGTLRARVV